MTLVVSVSVYICVAGGMLTGDVPSGDDVDVADEIFTDDMPQMMEEEREKDCVVGLFDWLLSVLDWMIHFLKKNTL